MAVFKCKMCGGALEINGNDTVAICEYCGTKQTLPKLDDERRANLYDRANHFRRNNEFDKAAGIYEQILNEDKADAEAYWSLVLCRYGIEYVEDPATHKRIPTVNRAQFVSVFDDENYKSALEYADASQRNIYEEEAKTINEIQKGILSISQKEEPFDVFICYKETDNGGRRTPDSVLANDLYHQLIIEGLKVFFARITLEDKLGTAYEPYIFAALNSAKVMVVLGTKPEYFNAVWVKNEWARYLSLIKNGANKILVPAYKDMDPYDLPEEFSHLQAQDMSKLGFMQDLIRGIKKITQADEAHATVVKETVVTSANANIDSLLKRAFMFLEDSDWNSADEYCEKVLDIDPENAQAYLGKLMAELGVKNQGALKDQAEPFDKSNNYQKVLRFGDESLKSMLVSYIDHINTRNENARLDGIYNTAKKVMSKAQTENDFIEAAEFFEATSEYKDSAKLAKECREKAENARKDVILENAKSYKNSPYIPGIEKAIALLKPISGYKDADEMIAFFEEKIATINAEVEQERIKSENTKKQIKKILKIATPVACVIIVFAILLNNVIIPNGKYKDALALMDEGKYSEAYYIFDDLYGYKDSADYLSKFVVYYNKVVHTRSDSDGDIYTNEYFYDSEGFLSKEIYTSPYDYDKYEYVYDSKGYLIQKIQKYDSGSIFDIYEYDYDFKGNLIKEMHTYYSSDAVHTYEYFYDGKNNLIEKNYTAPDGRVSREKYIYDSNGNMTKKTDEDYRYEYFYDSKGNMTKEIETTPYDSVHTTEYFYNRKGNLFKKIKTYSSGKVYTDTYTYDSSGNLIKVISKDSYGEIIDTLEYTYDDIGNVTKEIHMNSDGEIETIEYTYEGEHITYNP